tara:strand:- start:3574 stop:3954 length:381 start_codon:yes stop_codon:yes gene_type:complete
MKVEISNGELIDKLTILEIKLDKVKDKTQTDNILKEWDVLNDKVNLLFSVHSSQKLFKLHNELEEINKQLWWVEDSIRENEKKEIFDKEFVELARSVYKLNDKRFDLKQQINKITQSELHEEKLYS